MFKSALIRLTLWYVLLIMSLSLVFSGVLYHFSTEELTEALHNQYLVLKDNDKDDQTNVSTYELNVRSHQLLDNLIYFNIVVLVGSCLISYFLAKRTLQPIEAAHRAQIRFTADASHELRTPLTAMKADTEATLMKESNDPALLRETLQANLEDIKSLDKLTDHLVEVSRYDSKTTINKEKLELNQIIDEVIKQFDHQVQAKKLLIKTQTPATEIYGEAHGIRQLLTIILDNAVKYSNKNGTITIKLQKSHKYIIISVKDNGIGIPKADLPHIFERFYRSNNVDQSKLKTKGYGLGLPLAKEIVERHNGSINIQSGPETGTIVTVKLPRD